MNPLATPKRCHASSLLAVLLPLALGANSARADVVPYTADAHTLHLYHLDETAANIIDYGNGYNNVKINLWPNNVPSLGAAAYSGFGTSLNDAQALAVNSGAAIGAGPGSGTTPVTYANTQFQGADGSFTYEVYIKLNQISTLPYGGNGQAMILGHDGGNGNRNWDLKQSGANGIMFASNPDVAADQISFTIPTSGADAWNASSWFHLAVTFDGPTKAAKMYWTKVTPTVSGAHLIASKTLQDAAMTGTTDFTVGASARAWPQRYIDGYIDEVRISDIVRAAADMIVAGAPYNAWALTNITAINPTADATATGDPDGDGATNLTEFAFHGDPLSGANNGYHVSALEDTNGDGQKELTLTLAVRNGSGSPVFTGSPSPSASVDGITYTIEGSLDLNFPNSVVTETAAPTGLPALPTGWEYRRFRLDASNGLPGKGFLRAKVTQP